VLILAGFFASIVPPLVRQTANFIDAAPEILAEARSEDSSVGQFIRRYGLEDQSAKLSDELKGRLQDLGGTGLRTVSRISSSLFSTLAVLVLTFMMLIEGPRWLAFGRRLLPENQEKHYVQMAKDMYRVIRGYVNGQVLLAALAAVLIFPMLIILDIGYPVALLVIIFFCGLIPLVGHTIGAIIVTIIALFNSVPSAVIILAYYILYQQIENYVVQPKIQANSTNMSPLLVFSAVLIGVSFSGLLGGLVAIPVAGCLRILLLDILERKQILSPVESAKVPKPVPAVKKS
jgi:predicted PurR-regulated permease PerM